ncbi:MAG TPA: cell division protein FtsL [Pyrinomonadaceae bacterium]|nr:cell division protein FtsL [Pyrinomonadaceae bacterium]
MRRLPQTQRNSVVLRERDMRALSRLAMLLFCGLSLAGGFVFAAGQHFAAVRYGYESERLRCEREQLLEEQRRLLLEREQATSPARLESAARELGLQPVRPEQLEVKKSDDGVLPRPTTAFVNPSVALRR